MVRKPELLIPAGSLEEIKRYTEAGADAVNIGEEKFGLRLPGNIFLKDMKQAVNIAHENNAKVYVSVNNILDHSVLSDLIDYLKELQAYEVDAVVFGDPAVLQALKQIQWSIPLHWNAEMTSTNYATANYWASKGASRVIVARELNLEQVIEFKGNTSMEVQVQVHGMTNIYHSKRNLVNNYMAHQGKTTEQQVGLDEKLFLIEEERQDQKYPIYEDRNGTHIMSSEDICMLEDLHELMQGEIDSFKIEGLLKTVVYNVTVVEAYRKAIDAYAKNRNDYEFQPIWLETIEKMQPSDRELTFGFFYKEQVY